ncbi:hypothetical protein X975_16623, partial [Stegodyphus mimosarum]
YPKVTKIINWTSPKFWHFILLIVYIHTRAHTVLNKIKSAISTPDCLQSQGLKCHCIVGIEFIYRPIFFLFKNKMSPLLFLF